MLDLSQGRLDGLVAIVAGVETASGADWALFLARRGALVAAVAPSGDDVSRVVSSVEASGCTAFGFTGDVADPATIFRLVSHVEQRLGPIDAVVFASVGDVWPLLATTLPAMKARGIGTIGVVDGREGLLEEIRDAAGESIAVSALPANAEG